MTNSLLFGIATFVYFFAMVLYVSYLAFRSEMLGEGGEPLPARRRPCGNRGDRHEVVRILPDGDRARAADEYV